jgi:hypothetical protein
MIEAPLTDKQRQQLVLAILNLKRDKPEDWKKEVKRLVRELAYDDGLWQREHPEHRSAEMVGRKARSPLVSGPY